MNHGVVDPARLGQARLPDNRTLGWAEWGPETGSPVLFCPGAAMSRWIGFGDPILPELGVRLIAVDRPGLGASDPAPGRTLLDWAEDIRRFIDARGLAAPAIIGFSQGAPFALACAAAGVVTGAAVVSGTDELANPAFADLLNPDVRRVVEMVAADPASAEAFFSGMNADRMWNMVTGMSAEVDRVLYADPSVERAFKRAMAEGFAQGPAGYVRDTMIAMARWPFDPAAITVPVDLWYGEHDASPVHSPDVGASLAGRIPTARRHVLPEGGALLWTHGGPILRSLIDRAGRAGADQGEIGTALT